MWWLDRCPSRCRIHWYSKLLFWLYGILFACRQATHHAIYQPDVAQALSVDADDLGIKASSIEVHRRMKSASSSRRVVMASESGYQRQCGHSVDHQVFLIDLHLGNVGRDQQASQ